jgi:glyoxylase I family protein
MPLDFDGLCPLLQVFDMPTSVKFYREVLGFELVGNSPIVAGRDGDYFHWAMLRRGSNTIMLNTAYDEGQRPPAPDAARFAAHSDTALFFGCPDVEATYLHLLSSGVTVLEKPITTVYKMRRFTIADPDGYNLILSGPDNIPMSLGTRTNLPRRKRHPRPSQSSCKGHKWQRSSDHPGFVLGCSPRRDR